MPGNCVTATAVWRHNVLTRKVMVAALTIDMFQTVISNRSYIHWSHNISVKSADKHDRFSTSPVKSQSHVLRYGLAWSSVKLIIWAATSEFGTYRLCEQRRFRRACASAQSRQNLRCSLIQAMSQEEPSNRKPDPWPLWMAGHAQLKCVMTECSKTQIRLTGLISQMHRSSSNWIPSAALHTSYLHVYSWE